MARTYSTIATAIWADADFVRLTPDAKLVYFALITQAKISAAGLLEVKVRRWAKSIGVSEDRLQDALRELVETNYLVVDEDTDEVLVRSFVRHDNGWTNANRRRAILNAARSVESPTIRQVLAVELDRLGVDHDLHPAAPTEAARSASGREPAQDHPEAPHEGHSQARSEGASPRPPEATRQAACEAPGVVVVTKQPVATSTPEPQPASHNPGTSTLDPQPAITSTIAIADAAPTKPTTAANSDRPEIDELCRRLADRIESNGSKRPTITATWRDAARLMIDRDHRSATEIAAAIDWCQANEFWRSNVLSMPKLREKFDQMRLQASRAAPGTAPRKRTTDDRVQDGLALAQRLAAEDHAFHPELEPHR